MVIKDVYLGIKIKMVNHSHLCGQVTTHFLIVCYAMPQTHTHTTHIHTHTHNTHTHTYTHTQFSVFSQFFAPPPPSLLPPRVCGSGAQCSEAGPVEAPLDTLQEEGKNMR